MKRGTQIIYIPDHAGEDTSHPDCQTGFTTSDIRSDRYIFCRFWSKCSPGELRTKANSELTSVENITVATSVPQEQVEAALEKYCGE